MMRGFYNGVSGIKTQSFGMDVWANNVSNINNVGYKASMPEFKSIFYQSAVSAGNFPTTDQVGLGAVKQTTAIDFSAGGFQSTDETFDLAISGEGFYGVKSPNGQTYYTRTGHFDIDGSGNLVDDSGNLLLGTMNTITPTTPTASALAAYGKVGTTPQAYTLQKVESLELASESAQTGIKLPDFLYLPAEATTQVNFRGNLNSSITKQQQTTQLDSASYGYAVDDTAKTISVAGSVNLGGASGYKAGDNVLVRVSDAQGRYSEFNTQLDSAGLWTLTDQNIRYLDTANLSVTANITSESEVANTQKFTADLYNSDGTKSLLTINLTKQIPQEASQTTWNGIATITDTAGNVLNTATGSLIFGGDGTLTSNTLASVGGVTLNFGGDGTLVYNGMTSTASARTDFNISKDGFAEGILSSYGINSQGEIVANFNNSRAFPIAKIALYHFQNDQGVAKVGDNLYEATKNSGEAFFYKNAAGRTIYGSSISSGKLEMSNVDLAQALTEIIVIQKAYDASSKSITTSDEMIQTAIQMKQ